MRIYHRPRQAPPPDHPERWADNMTAGNFTGDHFRESSQWKMLLREHAQLISDDTFVLKRFLFRCPVNSKCARPLGSCHMKEPVVQKRTNKVNLWRGNLSCYRCVCSYTRLRKADR